MLDGPPPLISVPPPEITRHVPSGSIVPLAEILAAPVSPELRIALHLLHSAYKDTNLLVAVRPEMFTHGTTLTWLREQLGTTHDHICLSDGEAIRVVPGMKNHVFFYRAGHLSGTDGLLRLYRRAPDLFAGLATQINTAFALIPGPEGPLRTTLLPLKECSDEGLILPFFISRGPVERNAEALSRQGPAILPASKTLTYVAVSEAALQSIPFAAGLINKIIEAYTNPEHLLVIGTPLTSELEDALTLLLSGVRQHALTLPSGAPPNVFLHFGGCAALPGVAFGGQSRLVAYEADTFWRRTPAFYAPFEVATLLRDRNSVYHETDLGVVLQKLTGRIWEETTLPNAVQKSLARYAW